RHCPAAKRPHCLFRALLDPVLVFIDRAFRCTGRLLPGLEIRCRLLQSCVGVADVTRLNEFPLERKTRPEAIFELLNYRKLGVSSRGVTCASRSSVASCEPTSKLRP